MEEEFDRYANDYEHLVTDSIRDSFGGGSEFFHTRKMELLLRFLRRTGVSPSALTWLDVGCGQGELLRMGQSQFGRVAGCDPSAGMLTAARSIEVKQQPSATELPFESESFDLVTAVCVYHHVIPEERVKLTLEITRVLKKGGTFVMIEHNPINPLTQLVVSRVPIDKDAQLLSARSARRVEAAAGLNPFRTEYFLYLPRPLYKLLGRIENLLDWLPLGGQYASYALKR